jgi:hypothetical protein
MDVEHLFTLEHLLFSSRKCRCCGKEKDLLTDFYQTRKDRGAYPSSYSYECKTCTIKRIVQKRQKKINTIEWQYPDW